MRIPAIACCMLCTLATARSERLSAPDREALLERLEQIREDAESKIDARYRVALSAYRQAVSSNDEVMEFYLKCTEKVDFEDKDRKSSDFREWKRKNAERNANPGFRLALRYQLQWLILTLQVSPKDIDVLTFAPKATGILESIVGDADKLAGFGRTLNQSAASTIFARAYEIGGIKKEGWPQGPGQLSAIYEGLVFPPLRTPSRVSALRAAWIRRIQQEIVLHEAWSGGNEGKTRKGISNSNGRAIGSSEKSTEHDKYMAETVPDLQWQMEIDLYRAGDESGAAQRMLAHIEKYLTHKSSRRWGEQFTRLLMPEPVEAGGNPTQEDTGGLSGGL